MLDKHIL